MLVNVNSNEYTQYFPIDPNPFISEPFIELNRSKTESIIRLVSDSNKPDIGLIAGIKNKIVKSPFSAPFGGFHFKKDNIYIGKVDAFIADLKEYLIGIGSKGIEITLPPDIYHLSVNSKFVSSLIRGGFHQLIPDITNWVDLHHFNMKYSQRNTREYYGQAMRNGLSFESVSKTSEMIEVFELIHSNRVKFDRPLHMTFQDVQRTSNIWPTDFFRVVNKDNMIVASAIIYRNTPKICYALFWGDNDFGRQLRAMDYLIFNLLSHYKGEGFKYLDLGISTESGVPNEGLLRFKESHESNSALRYKFELTF